MKIIKPFGLSKLERLCSRKALDELFTSSTSIFHYPIRFVYQFVEKPENGAPAVVLFSVPRKKFKLAVRRNLIRRRMKEAFRLNKGIVLNSLESKPIQLRMAFLYIATDTCDFFKIQDAIVHALKDMAKRIDAND